MMRSESVINTALLIGGVRHTKGETLVPVMPCSIWEDALSDPRMAPQHHVAASLRSSGIGTTDKKSSRESSRTSRGESIDRLPRARCSTLTGSPGWTMDGRQRRHFPGLLGRRKTPDGSRLNAKKITTERERESQPANLETNSS